MTNVLIVHASRHGATAGIAERIGDTLARRGLKVYLAPSTDLVDPIAYDAVIVGAGVYMGSWVADGVRYLERYALSLASVPTWLFSSGPLRGSSKEPAEPVDAIEQALGPLTGPGSGGRRRIEELSARIQPRDHRVFYGAFDPLSPPTSLSERVVRMLPAAKNVLPAGDYRDWQAIEAWATEIADALQVPAPVG